MSQAADPTQNSQPYMQTYDPNTGQYRYRTRHEVEVNKVNMLNDIVKLQFACLQQLRQMNERLLTLEGQVAQFLPPQQQYSYSSAAGNPSPMPMQTPYPSPARTSVREMMPPPATTPIATSPTAPSNPSAPLPTSEVTSLAQLRSAVIDSVKRLQAEGKHNEALAL